jgi:toxin-antitoxin system PIN domain toxin
MIAVDAPILVFAHRSDSAFHARAAARMAELCRGPSRWALPMQSLAEFYAVVTHPRIYRPPSTPAQAVAQVEAWLHAPSAVVVYESDASRSVWSASLAPASVVGAMVHDARLAAVCAVERVTALWTQDRDFSRFGELTVHNPLVGP